MKKRTACFASLLLALVIPVLPAGSAQKYRAGEGLFVLSKSGLNIREKGEMWAKVLGLAPCGALVTMKGTPTGAVIVVEGIEGRWALVGFHGMNGYVFDGFLSRLRAPGKGCEGLDEYFIETFKQSGDRTERVEGGEGMEQKIIELAFSNGAALRHQDTTYWTEDPGWSRSSYRIPGIERIEEGFLLLRLLNYIDEKTGFPATGGNAGTDSEGRAIRAMVYKKGNEVQSLELSFRRPDYSPDGGVDHTEPRISIRREGPGIVMEIDNMKK